MPLISIIVPVYNIEKYLQMCIESILVQSFEDYEIILVNDGSTDDCPRLCNEYVSKDSRVKVIHRTNGGVSSARNVGIAMTEGKYIWFVDGDDTIEPEALQYLSDNISDNKLDLYVFNQSISKLYKMEFTSFFNEHYFKYHMGFGPWNKLYRRDIIIKNNIRFDEAETIGEDLLFNIHYYVHTLSIQFLDCQLYNYKIRESSAMTTPDKTRHIKQMRIFNKIQGTLKSIVPEEVLGQLYFMHLVSGLNQSRRAGMFFGDYYKWLRVYKKQFPYSKSTFQTALNNFFKSEQASILGRIRLRLLLM